MKDFYKIKYNNIVAINKEQDMNDLRHWDSNSTIGMVMGVFGGILAQASGFMKATIYGLLNITTSDWAVSLLIDLARSGFVALFCAIVGMWGKDLYATAKKKKVVANFFKKVKAVFTSKK